MFVSILVAIDGSTYAAKALDYAVGLSRKFPSKINLVHVVPIMSTMFPKLAKSKAECLIDIQANFEEEGKIILAEGEKAVKLAKLEVEVILRHGDIADEILETANEVKADLIVVGERGLGTGGRISLGSIAYRVSQHSKCPVLIIR